MQHIVCYQTISPYFPEQHALLGEISLTDGSVTECHL